MPGSEGIIAHRAGGGTGRDAGEGAVSGRISFLEGTFCIAVRGATSTTPDSVPMITPCQRAWKGRGRA
jgi:hypothetical protein